MFGLTRRKPMGHNLAEGSSALFAALSTLQRAVPDRIRDLVLVVVLFIVLDTMSGMWLAAKQAKLRSKRMKDSLISKCLQYACLGGLGGGVSILADSWSPFGAAIGAIVGIETLSIIENLTHLEQCGGTPLGPARPFLRKIAKYLQVQECDEDERTKP